TPDPGFTGTASFEYTINDGNGGIDTATVTVTVTEPPNTAPEAQPDRTTTQQDTAVTLAQSALLGNDTDPEGDPLTLTEVGN
ncbi:MAG: Ig-like domain-containing protein, partial [Limnospira sp.]